MGLTLVVEIGLSGYSDLGIETGVRAEAVLTPSGVEPLAAGKPSLQSINADGLDAADLLGCGAEVVAESGHAPGPEEDVPAEIPLGDGSRRMKSACRIQ